LKGFNIQQMMKQAQQMQKQMESAQEELQNTEVTGESGNGAVIVKSNAKNEIQSIKIKPEAVDPEDVETLEDLILIALQDANKKAAATVEQKMGAMTAGLPIKIPGLF